MLSQSVQRLATDLHEPDLQIPNDKIAKAFYKNENLFRNLLIVINPM